MKTCLFFFIIAGILLCACQEQDIMTFNDEHRLYFEKFYMDEVYPGTAPADSSVISFYFYPDHINDISVDLVMALSGKQLQSNLDFKLKVVPELTTAASGEYTIADHYTFRSKPLFEDTKEIKDTVQIVLHRSDRIATLPQGVRLVVELVPGTEYGLGQFERRRAVIIIQGIPGRPDWWTPEVEVWLLGKYTPTKLKVFLREIDPNATLNDEMIKNAPDQARKLVLEFKKWLSEQTPPVMDIDEEGNKFPMTVPL